MTGEIESNTGEITGCNVADVERNGMINIEINKGKYDLSNGINESVLQKQYQLNDHVINRM